MKGNWPKVFGKSGGKTDRGVREVRLSEIRANPFQPRKKIDTARLEELARSIREVGVINPVVLRETDGGYELIAGERRVRACQLAGMDTIPAIIKNLSDRETAEIAVIENLQREDLNYFEEAQSYAVLIGEFGMTQEEVAQRVGKTQAGVANKLRLLRLPERVRENISCDLISERHTRALLRLKNEEKQLEVLRRIYESGLTVRETEALIEEIGITISREIKNARRQPEKEKDIPSYVRTLRALAEKIKTAGFEAELIERDMGEWVELTVKVKKNRQQGTYVRV
jgi:ParB family chromosome partitioning protein